MTRLVKVKKIKKKFIYIGIVFLVLSFILLREKESLLWVEKIGKDTILFFQNLIINPVVDKNEESQSLQIIIAEKEELEKEILELKNMLSLKEMLSDKMVVTANIVYRNLGFFYDTVTINKGSSSGIEEGMAVVTKDGLIGKTVHVSNYSSDVQLLTSKQIGKVSVKIKSGEDYVYGLLTDYDQTKNVYKVEGISQTIDVVVGEKVTTTGFGDIFPSGILIGNVSNITTDHFDLAKLIEVTPSTNVHDFSIVSILKRNVN